MLYESPSEGDGWRAARGALAPVIVVGSSFAARQRGISQIDAAGLRVAAAVSVKEGIDRIGQQLKAGAVWIELDCDDGAVLDRLLDRVDRDSAKGLYGAVVTARPNLLDPVSARLSGGFVELLVESMAGEDAGGRAAALALATSTPARRASAADVATDGSAARLRQLSEEVSRIAATLARLSGGPGASANGMIVGTPSPLPAVSTGQSPMPELSSATLRALIRARRLRSRYFAEDLFADPAWDMLLDLTQAELTQIRVPVSSLCIAAAVPATTALRWIKTLTDAGLLLRRADPHDGRRVFIEMAPATSEAMRRYFAEVAAPAGV